MRLNEKDNLKLTDEKASDFLCPAGSASQDGSNELSRSPAGILLKNKQRNHFKKFYTNHPNYFKEYYNLHKKRINIRRRWRNKEKMKFKLLNNILNTKEVKKDKHWRFRQRHPERRKLNRQRNRALRKNVGNLSINTIQQVYEDNIKQYNTLTCIYCLKSIEFGQDSVEHKIPLSRGGTNEYNNLAVACYKCNVSKGSKTEKEYRDYLNTYAKV